MLIGIGLCIIAWVKDFTPIADCHSNYNNVDPSNDVVFTSDSRFVSENISQYNKI